MTAIQILEQLAVNPDYKRQTVKNDNVDEALSLRAKNEIDELLKNRGKFWCALVPAKEDEEPDEEQAPDEEQEKTSEN